MNRTVSKSFGPGIVLLLVLIFWVLLLTLSLSGCGVTSRLSTAAKQAPAFLFKSPEKSVEQTGLAAAPATVATASTVTEIPMPPGSSVTINAPAVDPFNPPTIPPPVVRVTDRREQVTTPTAYAPPAPPTLTEETDATALRRSYWIAGILAVIAALLAYRAHAKAAVIAGVAALAVVPVTKFIGSEWGQRVAIGAACISLALFAAWHFMNDKQRNDLKGTLS